MRRGEVWWADLGEPQGSAPGYRRPVVIVSANRLNETSIGTVIVAVVSSNLKLESALGNFRIPARAAGLGKPSVAVVSALATVDRENMLAHVGRLPDNLISRMNEGLRLALGIG